MYASVGSRPVTSVLCHLSSRLETGTWPTLFVSIISYFWREIIFAKFPSVCLTGIIFPPQQEVKNICFLLN